MGTPLTGWDKPSSPWHPGELLVQKRVGVQEKLDEVGRRVLRPFMPDEHRELFARLPFVIVGSQDTQRRPWASILVGRPGFVQTPDSRTLKINARPGWGDPLGANLAPGAPVGMLGIQLETRRRNRMNGTISVVSEDGFTIHVGQSFGNCPQYIQARDPDFIAEPSTAGTPRPVRVEGPILSTPAAELIARVDTLFIATASAAAGHAGDASEGVDVSHRGGRPGFVQVSEKNDGTTLTIPDFLGNFFFNTLGNIAVNPRAGLLFIDFETGGLLSLTGEAEIIWDGPEVEAFAGAERLLRFHVTEGLAIDEGVPLRWSKPAMAKQLAATGSWEEAQHSIDAAAQRNIYRPFTVARIEQESGSVRSFYLTPADGAGLATYRPGQFLPVALDIPGRSTAIRRTYTLSDVPGETYRISVKRETASHPDSASNWLHDHAKVGTVLHAMAPRGDFTLDPASTRPIVLLSGGIGITPMLAFVNHLMGGSEERARYPDRPVWFIHAARNAYEHAFGPHLRKLAQLRSNLTLHVRYDQAPPGDQVELHCDSTGLIDAALLKRLLPLDDYDFYVCGPAGFMQHIYDVLIRLGVDDARIHVEAFGPSTLKRRTSATPPVEMLPHAVRAEVEFRTSKISASWIPASGTLLDLAEDAGVDAPWSCRSGICGTCTAHLLDGSVTYATQPSAVCRVDEVLMCSALPASDRVVIQL